MPRPVVRRTAAAGVRIAGFAIVSTDGMLANAAGVMPAELKIGADQRFFAGGLERVDAVIHGRHSHEQLPDPRPRARLVLTRSTPGTAPAPGDETAVLWNPGGAPLDAALAALGKPVREIAVIGGGGVFEIFLDRYDLFYLSRVPRVLLPGGRPVFLQVPRQSPEQVLAAHGLAPGPTRILDPEKFVTVVTWARDGASGPDEMEQRPA